MARIETDKVLLETYSYDATGREQLPKGVAFPESEEEVREIVSLCRTKNLKITPRGAGTGFAGGSVPSPNSIVVSTERMDKIVDIDDKNLLALVEPGVVTAHLQKTASEFGLMYPPDPSSLESCTVGGNVATNAGGPKAVKYGVTADYVTGLSAVIGTSEVYQDLSPVRKNVVGLNVTPLFVGSEGTLGIITKVLLKLVPKPETRKLLLAHFRNLEDAGQAVWDIMKSPATPSALEIMDSTSIECVRKYRKLDIPKDIEGILLIELDGTKREVKESIDKIKEILKRYNASLEIASNQKEEDHIWSLRRAISPSLMEIAPTKINEDVTVPVSELSNALRAYKNVGKKYGLPVVCFGHAGDGNIHVNIMTDRNDPKLWKRGIKAAREIFIITVALNGVLSGEHGIGLAKKPYLGLQINEEQRNLYKRIKLCFDPDMILNPKKKF